MSLIDDSTRELLAALRDGADLAEAMRDATRRHIDRLAAASELEILAMDGCPRCHGEIVHGDTTAHCLAGCGFVYRVSQSEPLASRRADP